MEANFEYTTLMLDMCFKTYYFEFRVSREKNVSVIYS